VKGARSTGAPRVFQRLWNVPGGAAGMRVLNIMIAVRQALAPPNIPGFVERNVHQVVAPTFVEKMDVGGLAGSAILARCARVGSACAVLIVRDEAVGAMDVGGAVGIANPIKSVRMAFAWMKPAAVVMWAPRGNVWGPPW